MSFSTWGVEIFGAKVNGFALNEATKERFPDSTTIDEEVLLEVLAEHPFLVYSSAEGGEDVYI